MNHQIDVRAILPAIHVPTLVLHRSGDRAVGVEEGRYLAEHIPGARFVELAGNDHLWWVGDSESIVNEIEEFLTGERHAVEPDRVLVTMLFTDIVASTQRAAEMGDRGWRDLLDRHNAVMQAEIDRFRGRVVKSTGDGYLATFDGPARAIHCACAASREMRRLGIEIRSAVHTGEVELIGRMSAASRFTPRRGFWQKPRRMKCGPRGPSRIWSPAHDSGSANAEPTPSKEFQAIGRCSP